jgi:hypothetical protein
LNSRSGIKVKKLVLPIFMAAVGALAISLIVSNVLATSPTTLKVMRIDDVSYSVTGGETIKLTIGTQAVIVDARPTDGKAVIEVTGNTEFKEGENTLSVKVTGSDGKTFKVYTWTLISPKLAGWCQDNTELIKTIETNWADEQIYEMPGYAELGTNAADIKAHNECFSTSLIEEINKNY